MSVSRVFLVHYITGVFQGCGPICHWGSEITLSRRDNMLGNRQIGKVSTKHYNTFEYLGVLATFVHLSISSISNPILTKLFGAIFWGIKHFFEQHFVGPKLLGYKIIKTQNYLGPKVLLGSIFFKQKLFYIQNFILKQNF